LFALLTFLFKFRKLGVYKRVIVTISYYTIAAYCVFQVFCMFPNSMGHTEAAVALGMGTRVLDSGTERVPAPNISERLTRTLL